MTQKPWSIRVLALVQLLTPLFNLTLGAIMYKIAPWTFFDAIVRHGNRLETIEFFFLGPIAAIAILRVRWWSYPVFLACVFRTGYSNFLEWHKNPALVGYFPLFICYFMNILLVSYFLIPRIRKAYFNPKIRWWETKPRYAIFLDSELTVKGKSKPCILVNVSEGGAMIESPTQIEPQTRVTLEFSCLNQNFKVDGEVVYELQNSSESKSPNRKKFIHGVQFVFTPETKKRIKNCTQALELLGLDRRPAREDKVETFMNWIRDILEHFQFKTT